MEEYRAINGFDNYLVSNFGNIKNTNTNKILAGSNASNYLFVKLYKDKKCTKHQIHRLVALTFLPNNENKSCVDHIDNNTLNNNLVNLRYATTQENARNSKLSISNTSGFKGVTFDKSRNKYAAQITIDGIKVNLGRFDTIDEAKNARIAKANIVFGIYKNICEI